MNDNETDEVPADVPPVRKRQPQPRRQPRGRSVSISRMQDGKPTQFGMFPETVIGEPLEQRILPFMEERNFGPGNWKVDIRTAKGHFERSFDFTIEESYGHAGVIDADVEDLLPAEDDAFEESNFLGSNAGAMTPAEVENLLLKERLRRLEEDARNRTSNGNAETNSFLNMLQQSWNQQRDFMMLMLQQKTESQRPQVDATSQALDLMEKSFSMVTKARQFADEIAPDSGGGEGGGSFLADGAKLLDSIGRNAGPFIPAIASMLTRPATGQPNIPTPGGFPNAGTGEFADLAAKARSGGTTREPEPEKTEAAKA